MHYQPTVSFADGRPVGVEALVRWNHPERGLVYPDAFLDLVEQSGLMRQLTHLVLAKSLAQAAAVVARRASSVPVAVNVSVRDLSDTSFADVVAGLLRDHDLPARALQLEITEHVLMADPAPDDARAGVDRAPRRRPQPGRLRHRLLVAGAPQAAARSRELKVDRSFVQRMTSDADDAVIVRSIVDLAHSLGLRVVAEGVETDRDLAGAGGARLRPGPGLPDQPAGAGRRGHPLAGRALRAGSRRGSRTPDRRLVRPAPRMVGPSGPRRPAPPRSLSPP